MFISELIDRYLIHCQANHVHGAEAHSERMHTLGLFRARFGEMEASAILPHHLQDWIEGNARWKSSSTKKAKANQVNAAFNWAADGRRIAENPLRCVRFAEAERRPCLPDAVFAMLCEHGNKAFERAITFLRLTGCRLSDLCRLEWNHVDFERSVVILPRHKTSKKTGKPLVFALTIGALEILRKIKAEHYREGVVFRNSCGRPWTRGSLGQNLARIKERLGKDFAASLHGIRHQFATSAIKNGAPLLFVSKQLGHASTLITERYYVHVDDDVDGRMGAAESAKPK